VARPCTLWASPPLEQAAGGGVVATFLFQLVAKRYEEGAIILSRNRSFSEGGELFTDQVLATALSDRLLHHSSIINIRGQSYRLKEKRQALKLAAAPPPLAPAGARGGEGLL
jgi:hypothetical protein